MNHASAPTLTVIIVSYNTRDHLAGCLNSLRRVSDETNMEVIVVDNGSADGSAETVKKQFPEVILVEAGKNLGFAAANNLGLAQARGKFLFFLNPDTLVSRGTLVQMLRFMEETEHPFGSAKGKGVAGARLIYPNGKEQLSVLEFPDLWREFWNFLPEIKAMLVSVKHAMNSVLPFPARRDLKPRRARAVSGAAMMVRADAIKEVGGFDEGFFLYHEERDLCYRLSTAGWEIWTVPTATVAHFDAQSSGYSPKHFPRSPILEYRILGMERLYRKHRPGWRHGIWSLRSRIMLRLRAWWRRAKGNREGAEELLRVVTDLYSRRRVET